MRWNSFVPSVAEREVFEPMFRAALQGTRSGLAGGVVLAASLTWLFLPWLEGAAYAAWMAAFALLVVVRAATLVAFARLPDRQLGAPHAAITTALFFLVGIVWGLAGFVFPIDAAPWAPYAVLTVQLLMVVMAVPGLSWYWPCFAAFALPVLLLAPWPWLGVQSDVATVVAIGAVFNLGAFAAFSGRHAGVQLATLRLRAERARMVEELQEKGAALARSLAVKSRFLAGASHDLRQPLHAMALMLKTARDEARPLGAEDQRTLGAMVDSADEMLQSLVEAARGDDPDGSWPVQDCDAQAIVDAVTDEQAAHAAARGLLLRVRYGAWTVRSNPVALQRIARNLLSNAIKYASAGGVLVALRRRAGQVWLEVWDTGPGIPEQEREAVFAPYRRGDVAAQRTAGAGLGLAVVRQLCGALGHPIELRSRPGRGSVFRVGLGTPVPVRPDAVATQPGGAVLLVMRDPALTGRVQSLLQQWELPCRTQAGPGELLATPPRAGEIPLIEGPAWPADEVEALRAGLQRQGRLSLWLVREPGRSVPLPAAELPLPLEALRLRAALSRLAALSRPADAGARSPASVN